MRLLLALALVLPAAALAGPARDTILYDFQWESIATLSRWDAGDTVTERGELYRRGQLRYERMPDGSATFEFTSPVGGGRGRIIDGALLAVIFPTALEVGRPPAPPHLSGGSFKPLGDPQRPESFDLSFAEGFICRTTPPRCGNVKAWSRELTGTATLVR